MLLLVLGGTLVHSSFGMVADAGVTLIAAIALAVTHFFNSRLARHGNANTL